MTGTPRTIAGKRSIRQSQYITNPKLNEPEYYQLKDRGSVNRPKFHCEEFDIGVESRPLSEEIALSIAPIVGGLCCNCANRTHCVDQPQEGDIWHCEEYC